MGRILPASRTGCTTRNQRRLGKAIRRARAMGFLPIWSRHPMTLTTSGGAAIGDPEIDARVISDLTERVTRRKAY